jgi:hypothetical protein
MFGREDKKIKKQKKDNVGISWKKHTNKDMLIVKTRIKGRDERGFSNFHIF